MLNLSILGYQTGSWTCEAGAQGKGNLSISVLVSSTNSQNLCPENWGGFPRKKGEEKSTEDVIWGMLLFEIRTRLYRWQCQQQKTEEERKRITRQRHRFQPKEVCQGGSVKCLWFTGRPSLQRRVTGLRKREMLTWTRVVSVSLWEKSGFGWK